MFNLGENEWHELHEEINVHSSRTPNQLALKWRQIKRVMLSDINKISKSQIPNKLISQYEWMSAAILTLDKLALKSQPDQEEKADTNQPGEFKKFYEALFIDPGELTPY